MANYYAASLLIAGDKALVMNISYYGAVSYHLDPPSLRYMNATPLILWIALIGVGSVGIGLLIGGAFAGSWRKRVMFDRYKRTIVVCYVLHGGPYVLFGQAPTFGLARIFIALSRSVAAVSAVLNFFATMQSMVWCTMMLSMMAAVIASRYLSQPPRYSGSVYAPQEEVEIHGELTV